MKGLSLPSPHPPQVVHERVNLSISPVSFKRCPKCREKRFKTAASLANHKKYCTGAPSSHPTPNEPRFNENQDRRIVEEEDDFELDLGNEGDGEVDHVGGSGDWNPQPRHVPLLRLGLSDDEEPKERDMNDNTIESVIYVDGYSDNDGEGEDEPRRDLLSSDGDSDYEAHHDHGHGQDSDAGSDIEEEEEEEEEEDSDADQSGSSTAFSLENNLPMNLCECFSLSLQYQSLMVFVFELPVAFLFLSFDYRCHSVSFDGARELAY